MSPGLVQTVTAGPHIPALPASLRIPGPTTPTGPPQSATCVVASAPSSATNAGSGRSTSVPMSTGRGCDLLMARGC